jgi:hypothetical protein
VIASLPLEPNSGTISATRWSSRSFWEPRSNHTADATNAFVTEKTRNRLSFVALPNVSKAINCPSFATAS